MEIVFGIISVMLAFLLVYLIGRLFFSHRGLMIFYRYDNILAPYITLMTIILFICIFLILVAYNDTFWHLSYLFK